MKFKARLSMGGYQLLLSYFLPALEKVDKEAHLYLTPTHVRLCQNFFNLNGVHACASFKKETIFEDYKIESRADNCIALKLEIPHIVRALQSIRRVLASESGEVTVKLVRRQTPGQPPGSRGNPYLAFNVHRRIDSVDGISMEPFEQKLLLQDVPISEPLGSLDLERLEQGLSTADAGSYLCLPELSRIHAVVDRLKQISEEILVANSQDGRLFLRANTDDVSVGSEFSNLPVLGEKASCEILNIIGAPAERLQRARDEGIVSSVTVSVKHLSQCLYCRLTNPDLTVCAVAGANAYLVLACQYKEDDFSEDVGDSITLEYKLPVLDALDDPDVTQRE